MVVATVTLLWGAILGCAKDDIKKGLAGSTRPLVGGEEVVRGKEGQVLSALGFSEGALHALPQFRLGAVL